MSTKFTLRLERTDVYPNGAYDVEGVASTTVEPDSYYFCTHDQTDLFYWLVEQLYHEMREKDLL